MYVHSLHQWCYYLHVPNVRLTSSTYRIHVITQMRNVVQWWGLENIVALVSMKERGMYQKANDKFEYFAFFLKSIPLKQTQRPQLNRELTCLAREKKIEGTSPLKDPHNKLTSMLMMVHKKESVSYTHLTLPTNREV